MGKQKKPQNGLQKAKKKKTHKQLWGYTPIPTPAKETRLQAYLPYLAQNKGIKYTARHLQYNMELVRTDFRRLKAKDLTKTETTTPNLEIARIIENLEGNGENDQPLTNPNNLDKKGAYRWDGGLDRLGIALQQLMAYAAKRNDMGLVIAYMDRYIKAYTAKMGGTRVSIMNDNRQVHVTIYEAKVDIMKRFIKRSLRYIPAASKDEWEAELSQEFDEDESI